MQQLAINIHTLIITLHSVCVTGVVHGGAVAQRRLLFETVCQELQSYLIRYKINMLDSGY